MCKLNDKCVENRKNFMITDEDVSEVEFISINEDQERLLMYLKAKGLFRYDIEITSIDEIEVECI